MVRGGCAAALLLSWLALLPLSVLILLLLVAAFVGIDLQNLVDYIGNLSTASTAQIIFRKLKHDILSKKTDSSNTWLKNAKQDLAEEYIALKHPELAAKFHLDTTKR
jgi:hypothetical protein